MKLVYIIGTSYSGSTLLGAYLGLQPDSFCAGELGSWTLRQGSEKLACSCGITRVDCPFWQEVKSKWLKNGTIGWEDIRKIQSPIERFRRVSSIRIGSNPNARLDEYSNLMRNLFNILSEVSGKQIVIDTSKRVGRAASLARVDDLDITYIHLVRDGRGFLASRLKRFEQGRQGLTGTLISNNFIIRSSLEWIMINRTAERILSSSRRPFLRLRYEDLVLHPVESLERIGGLLGVGMDDVVSQMASDEPIPRGHIGGGNLNHLSGQIVFHLDESWKQTLPRSAQHLFWLFACQIAFKYGYTRPG